MSELEFPRWEHHPSHGSILVEDAEQRDELLARWASSADTLLAENAPIVPAASSQFQVYDAASDGMRPMTSDDLDRLVFAEQLFDRLWGAIRNEQDDGTTFPAKLMDVIVGIADEIATKRGDAPPEHGSTEAGPASGGGGVTTAEPRRGGWPKGKPRKAT